MSEPAVALTDFALAAESAVFARLLAGRAGALLFAGLSAGALFGGLHHAGLAQAASWRLCTAALGVAAFACWRLGANLALPAALRRGAAAAAGLALAAYLPFVLVADRDFLVPALALGSGSALLLGCLAVRGLHLGAAGLLLSLAGALLQQLGVGLGPHFDHNALYHAIQMLAIALVYGSLRRGDLPC